MSLFRKLLVLTPSECIMEEMVVGIFPHAEIQTTAALEIPSKESLLHGTSLMITKPRGESVVDPALVEPLEKEMCSILGGWFCGDLAPYIEFYEDLLSPSYREQYYKSGLSIMGNRPAESFYYLAFSVPPWQIQAVGVVGDFHTIFLGQLLNQSQALGKGGHLIYKPVGAIEPVLAESISNIDLKQLTDNATEHAVNVFDSYLMDKGLVVKAGVRMRLAEGGAAFQGEEAYFYGIRVSIDLKLID